MVLRAGTEHCLPCPAPAQTLHARSSLLADCSWQSLAEAAASETSCCAGAKFISRWILHFVAPGKQGQPDGVTLEGFAGNSFSDSWEDGTLGRGKRERLWAEIYWGELQEGPSAPHKSPTICSITCSEGTEPGSSPSRDPCKNFFQTFLPSLWIIYQQHFNCKQLLSCQRTPRQMFKKPWFQPADRNGFLGQSTAASPRLKNTNPKPVLTWYWIWITTGVFRIVSLGNNWLIKGFREEDKR